ncbi:MAG: LamG-like jellyroll fold domain-containing protein [Pyrinomonadaceae bacterium]
MKTTIIAAIFLLLLGFSTTTISAQVCTPPPSGLVSWYRAEGNTLDFTGINNGTPNGVTYAAGEVAQAFQFNGSSSVEVPDSTSLDFTNAITIEGWVNPTVFSNFGTIVNKGRLDTFGGQPYSVLTVNGGGSIALNFRLGNSSTYDDIVGGSIPLNAYTHFGATYDGTTMNLYVNGMLKATKTTTIGTLANDNLGLHIGSSTGFSFFGAIDEISLYNRALSLSEIQAIFNAGTAGKCLSPTAASVTVSGRVVTTKGRGIFRAQVSLTDSGGETQRVYTNPFGYYRFEDVPAGETYILNIYHKHYQFENPTQVLNVNDEMENVNFTASP